jgi:AhpD family alkylhydroperoxidase
MKHQKKEEKGCCCSESDCAEAGISSGGTGTVPASMKAFGELLTSVTATGKVDKRVKELIIFSLVVLQRCEQCVDLHYTKALGMGITKEELDEAAWCAILIGGAPVKMCYAAFLSKRNSK